MLHYFENLPLPAFRLTTPLLRLLLPSLCRTLNTLDIVALNPGCEQPVRKIVGKLALRIMLRHQLPETAKVFAVQSFQICAVNIFAVLAQGGRAPIFLINSSAAA